MKCLDIVVNVLLLPTSVQALQNISLYRLTPVDDGDEWSSELDSVGELDSEDNLDSWLLCVSEG